MKIELYFIRKEKDGTGELIPVANLPQNGDLLTKEQQRKLFGTLADMRAVAMGNERSEWLASYRGTLEIPDLSDCTT